MQCVGATLRNRGDCAAAEDLLEHHILGSGSQGALYVRYLVTAQCKPSGRFPDGRCDILLAMLQSTVLYHVIHDRRSPHVDTSDRL